MSKPDSIRYESEFSVLLDSSKGANSRKKILRTLLLGSKSCNQIAIKLKLNWRTAYRHLQILEEKNLVRSLGFGQRKFYKLTLKGEEVIGSIKSKNTLPNIKKDPQIKHYLNDETEKTIN